MSQPIPKVRSKFYYSFNRMNDDISAGFAQHGDIIQLTGFPAKVFCFRNPEHIDVIFKDPSAGLWKIPAVFARLKSFMPHSVVAQVKGEEWAEKRAQVQSLFRNDYIERYFQQAAELIDHMVDVRWKHYADTGSSIDLYDELQVALTQIGFKIFFSKDLTEDEARVIKKKSFLVESEFVKRQAPFLPFGIDARVRKATRELHQIMHGLIAERRINVEAHDDVISVMIKSTKGQHDADAFIADQMLELYTSVRLANPPLALGLRLIAYHPDVQEKLAAEFKTGLAVRRASLEDYNQLKYFRMVLHEIFRFYPSTWGIPRWCDKGMQVGDYTIPKKSVLMSMIYHTHRNPNLFKTPELFIPERWDPANPDTQHPRAKLGYGAGKRMCPGAHLGNILIFQIITAILQRYRVESQEAPGTDPRNVALLVHPYSTLPFKLTRRLARRISATN